MTPLTFAALHLNRYVTAPGGLGRQCVDLVNLYLIEVHGLPPHQANAVEWQKIVLAGWKWVANKPMNAPTKGAIVVWRPSPFYGIGTYGHVALVMAADSLHMVTLDQDWPLGAPVQLTLHDYGGVVGWLGY